MDIREKLARIKNTVDARLEELLINDAPALLRDSMAYSVRAGGKRLRPALHLLAAELMGGGIGQSLDIACAIELIHTYSLIHDDLPALDDDTLRRGRPTNHTVYGEAQAILAGDGLLNYAYEVMLKNALRFPENAAAHLRAIAIVARAAGVTGMVAGQVMDVALVGKVLSQSELSYIDAHKTGDMITGALLSGIEPYAPSKQQRDALETYGKNIGLAFQIVDDVLDVTAGAELGKSRGKDAAQGKVTYASLLGIEDAMHKAANCTCTAKEALRPFEGKAVYLNELADYMLARES